MCDKESFARLRGQTESNSKQIAALVESDAVQSVQIKYLPGVTKEQGQNQLRPVNKLVLAVVGIIILVVLALIFGALGKDGFNGVVKATPDVVRAVSSAGIFQPKKSQAAKEVQNDELVG